MGESLSNSRTLEEIFEQPQSWLDTLAYLDQFDHWDAVSDLCGGGAEWLLIGCGSSYCIAAAAVPAFKEILLAPARAIPASELLLFPEQNLLSASTRVVPVLISRSGYTSEVLRTARLLRQRNIPFIGISCEHNELSALADVPFELPVHEKSTVMTRSFTSMLLTLQYIAARCSGNLELIRRFAALPGNVKQLLAKFAPSIERLVAGDFENFVFLGQGSLFAIAQECAIKTTEASQSYVQSYHTLEFRHGPKSIVSSRVLTTLLISEAGYAEESAMALEIKKLGGAAAVIANDVAEQLSQSADLSIDLRLDVPECIRSVAYVIWGQLIGVYLGLHKGLDPDQPHNLSRVVVLQD